MNMQSTAMSVACSIILCITISELVLIQEKNKPLYAYNGCLQLCILIEGTFTLSECAVPVRS